MKSNFVIPISLIVILMFSSCAKNRIQGTWLVQRERKDRAGMKEREHEAGWITFKKDYLQESGNGWQKHSYGSWILKKKRLNVNNTNGFTDFYGSFDVKFVKNGLELIRVEEGNKRRLYLKKIDVIPPANRDQLLGVWELKRALEDGKDASQKYNSDKNMYIHFRWDNFFLVGNSPQGTMSGIYRTDGKIDEIELFYNNSTRDRSTWMIEQKKNTLVFTSINLEKEIIMQYKRIDYLPE